MHALIIEDEEFIAALIEEALIDIGFTSFAWATSSERALLLARERTPDLITADVMLNPGSGVEAVTQIKTELDVPVVFVTGDPHKVTPIPRAAIVAKPFTLDHLKRACSDVLRA